jgi:hypothetical protein
MTGLNPQKPNAAREGDAPRYSAVQRARETASTRRGQGRRTRAAAGLALAAGILSSAPACRPQDSTAAAASAGPGRDSTTAVSAAPFRKVNNRAFAAGEYLVFDIAYGPVKAGTATMGIPDTARVGGRPCLHIVTTAESSPFFSNFFNVKDRVESLFDSEGIFSWRFDKHLREGHYKAERTELYDQANRRVFYRNDTIPAPLYVMDILCAFYYTRTQPLEVGGHLDLDAFGDGAVYPLRVLVHRRETIKVPAGRFACIVVEPVIKGEGIFNQKGKLTIWLTDDERRLPVLLKSKVLVGSIDCRLRRIGK